MKKMSTKMRNVKVFLFRKNYINTFHLSELLRAVDVDLKTVFIDFLNYIL